MVSRGEPHAQHGDGFLSSAATALFSWRGRMMSVSTDGIPASFTWTFDDFVALRRAGSMLQNRLHDSWLLRAVGLFLGHAFLIGGVVLAGMACAGVRGAKGPIPPEAVVVNVLLALGAAYYLFTRWYGWRRVTERAFRSSELSGVQVHYRFLPNLVEVSSPKVDARQDWSVLSEVVEFRDAFLLLSGPIANWLPRRAFGSPDEVEAFIALARSSVKRYRVIGRWTFLKSDPWDAVPARPQSRRFDS